MEGIGLVRWSELNAKLRENSVYICREGWFYSGNGAMISFYASYSKQFFFCGYRVRYSKFTNIILEFFNNQPIIGE